MRVIHFTAADLARTRLKTSLGPVAETVFALDLFGRPGAPSYARWRRQATGRLRARGTLERLVHDPERTAGDSEELLRLVERSEDADDFVLRMLSPGRRRAPQAAVNALLEMWRAGVAPYWDRILGHLEAECEIRGRIVMTGGVEQLLATLHPQILWEAPVLRIPGGPAGEVFLDGRGLVLSPSAFLCDSPGRLVGTEQPALVFAAPPAAQQAALLWDEPDSSTQALGSLVGQTRAAALRALRATCTTSQLADLLGISAAGASQHTAVLRQTGLITTRRIRNTVLHTVTPLGVALLNGHDRRPDLPALSSR